MNSTVICPMLQRLRLPVCLDNVFSVTIRERDCVGDGCMLCCGWGGVWHVHCAVCERPFVKEHAGSRLFTHVTACLAVWVLDAGCVGACRAGFDCWHQQLGCVGRTTHELIKIISRECHWWRF
jgi:hypothetical protein